MKTLFDQLYNAPTEDAVNNIIQNNHIFQIFASWGG